MRGPARCRDGLDRRQRGGQPLEVGQLPLDEHRRRRSPRAAICSARYPSARPGRSVATAARGRRDPGMRSRSSRWNVPPEAVARSAVIAETMLPAAPVIRKTESLASSIAPGGVRRPGGTADVASPTPQRWPSTWPISTQPGSDSVSSIRTSASAAVLRLAREVDGLDQDVGALALVGLGEADTVPPSGAVAPASSYPWCPPRRVPTTRNGLASITWWNSACSATTRRRSASRQQARSMSPSGSLIVEGGQPVDAGQRCVGRPLLDLREQVVGGGGGSDGEHVSAAPGELLDQRCRHRRRRGRPGSARLRRARRRSGCTPPGRGRRAGIGTRRGRASTAAKSPTNSAALDARSGVRLSAWPAGVRCGWVDGGGCTGWMPVLSRTQPMTWVRVGKSRRARFSSRSTLNRSRTAAKTSACLTVSTPRSASRSRSRSSSSGWVAGHLGHDPDDGVGDLVGGRGCRAAGAGAPARAAAAAGAAAGAAAAGWMPVLSRTQPMTWVRVGKSRRARFSSRSTLNRSRTAANTSACLTVSTPRSASRSRSRSSSFGGVAGHLGHDPDDGVGDLVSRRVAAGRRRGGATGVAAGWRGGRRGGGGLGCRSCRGPSR